jgi:hypothetical protein
MPHVFLNNGHFQLKWPFSLKKPCRMTMMSYMNVLIQSAKVGIRSAEMSEFPDFFAWLQSWTETRSRKKGRKQALETRQEKMFAAGLNLMKSSLSRPQLPVQLAVGKRFSHEYGMLSSS